MSHGIKLSHSWTPLYEGLRISRIRYHIYYIVLHRDTEIDDL